ncbi:unnamed protein product [Mytilus coruscus]|uniref:B box-type domain-containing protein n=1 Tax=Mytilus coruscus TaxID=42192 RepID=A0A6J8E1R6_MYTCO|nr:unnamed protein product [Mytilus coruscus]
MADDMLEREEKEEIGKFSKQLRCRYHETEEYTIFCKDCKDFMCFKCIGQLHQKHDMSQLQDAEEDIWKEMEVLLLNGKYSEQLTALDNKLSDIQKKLLQDVERLNCEIKTSCDKIANQPIPGFTPTIIEPSSGKRHDGKLLLSTCSNISTQTDFLEDSETEWFDAEDIEEEDLIGSSSDEVTDKYPIRCLDTCKPAIAKKIVNHSLDDIVYADNVSDFVVLKDACVLILSEENSFIMKLLTDRRQVRFANIGRPGRKPHCFCISEDDLLVVYLVSYFGKPWYEFINYFIWMNTDGIVTDQASFSKSTFQKPCRIQILESYLCVLYCEGNTSDLHRIELLEKKSDTYNSVKIFSGIYGFDAWEHFQSIEMCVYKDGNIIISDFRHHSVYMVDKDLKYKNTLLDARNGFDKPAAIGIFNDHMWIADGNQIFIFNLAYT